MKTLDDIKQDFRALHNICRFNGHVKRFYSVAEHTAIGLHCMRRDGVREVSQKAFLLHDLPEAALGLGDLNRNTKRDPIIDEIVFQRETEYFDALAPVLGFGPWEMAEHYPTIRYYDHLVGVAEVETIAHVPHDHPDDFDDEKHGFAAYMITKAPKRAELQVFTEGLFGFNLWE